METGMNQVPGEVVGEEQGLMEVVRPLGILMVCEVDPCHHQGECLVPWLQAGGGGDSPDGGQQGSLGHIEGRHPELRLQAGGRVEAWGLATLGHTQAGGGGGGLRLPEESSGQGGSKKTNTTIFLQISLQNSECKNCILRPLQFFPRPTMKGCCGQQMASFLVVLVLVLLGLPRSNESKDDLYDLLPISTISTISTNPKIPKFQNSNIKKIPQIQISKYPNI